MVRSLKTSCLFEPSFGTWSYANSSSLEPSDVLIIIWLGRTQIFFKGNSWEPKSVFIKVNREIQFTSPLCKIGSSFDNSLVK